MREPENDIIFDKFQSILNHIGRCNSDFVCSCCLSTAEDILSLARYILGADAAGLLEQYYDEARGEED